MCDSDGDYEETQLTPRDNETVQEVPVVEEQLVSVDEPVIKPVVEHVIETVIEPVVEPLVKHIAEQEINEVGKEEEILLTEQPNNKKDLKKRFFKFVSSFFNHDKKNKD